jgi:hypothetical protein
VFKPYGIQTAQQSDEDHRRRLDFCLQLQDLMVSDEHFLEKVQFSDEATLHVRFAANVTISEYGTHMLTRVWQELEHRIDVCPVTRGAHIEHL